MSSKPIEQFVKKQVREQGGWQRILERIASGETVSDVARTIKRPDGQTISRSFFSRLLHQDPERSAQATQARIEGASAMVDDAIHGVAIAQVDRDSINKAKVLGDMKIKVAGFIDRQGWGENKQPQVNINVASLHLDALRHRTVELPTEHDADSLQPTATVSLAAQTSGDQPTLARGTA